MEFETVAGLEIHVELATETKAFCACKTKFGAGANKQCCPVCMGLPGSLPSVNKKVVEYALKLGAALHCEIPSFSHFVRKHYFYPDLPKGYQISQLEKPVCVRGFMNVNGRRIRINRIQIEEDAGKLIHEGELSLVDYNRVGIPLLEIVTEPDIRSADEAKELLDEMRLILLYIGISECRMQEGNLRCDVNVSVRKKGDEKYNPRCEMKNINSFSEVCHAIEYESARHTDIMKSGLSASEETRRWDEKQRVSVPMRSKEQSVDYRYLPEPNIPPVFISDAEIEKIKCELPMLPQEKREAYVKIYKLSKYEARTIVKRKDFTELFEEALQNGASPKSAANLIMGDISRLAKEADGKLNFSGKNVAEIISLAEKKIISQHAVKKYWKKLLSITDLMIK